MPKSGLSSVIPKAVFDGYRPVISAGWELAALGYVLSVCAGVIAGLVEGFSVGFHEGVGGLFFGSSLLYLGLPLSIVAITLVARLRHSGMTDLGYEAMDAALTIFFFLGLLSAVIGVLGFIDAFGDNGFANLLADLFAHVADMLFGAVAVVWSVSEISRLRAAVPAAGRLNVAEGAPAPVVEDGPATA